MADNGDPGEQAGPGVEAVARLQRQMEALGLTASRLAEMIEVPQTTLARQLRTSTLTLDNFIKSTAAIREAAERLGRAIPTTLLLPDVDWLTQRELPQHGLMPRPPRPIVTTRDTSFLKPRAQDEYDRLVGSYRRRGWPEEVIDQVSRELVQAITGASTMRGQGAGRADLSEEDQLLAIGGAARDIEEEYAARWTKR